MASQAPLSCVTAETDVNLDFLTKEEREALLSKKMDIIRQRNKVLNERHAMIEADRRKAEESGNAIKAMDSKTLPAEGVPNKPKGRGRGQGQGAFKESNKPMKDRPKSHGDASSYEPIVDVSDFSISVQRTDNNKNKGRGGQNYHDKDGIPASTSKNRRKPQAKEEGYNAGQARSKRRNDPNPPPDPTFNPLADRRRGGGGGGFDKKESNKKDGGEHKRHPRNYGGGADLTKVKDAMKTMREKERDRPASSKPLDMVMTGRERKNHEQWKQERDKYDNERIQRQLGEGGNWKREWDIDKVIDYDDSHQNRKEPAKRPAGRIGSGRFDRGDSREEQRPRATNRDGKGAAPPQYQSNQTGLSSHHHIQPQATSPPAQYAPQNTPHNAPLSPPAPVQQGDGKIPKGKGRGRGRGRGRGNSQASGPGDKSPRPRTWSGGDDRFVECQKEILLVKFDNTAGDNTVEVEYEAPLSPSLSSKSSGSTPGRGPTGRTPNQTAGPRQKGGKQGNPKQDKYPKGKAGSGRLSGHFPSQETHRAHPDQFVDAEWDTRINHRHSYDGSKVRTSSHSQSHGDSEEWEDCTESSGVPEEDDMDGLYNLRVELNPEAPEFLPTSPEFLKTPPGHVKVLNWKGAGVNSPTSPQSSLSQLSYSSQSPRQKENSSNHQSPVSSPGSSASTRAKNRREEMDAMPEPDQPLPPPFLLPEEIAISKDGDPVEKLENGIKVMPNEEVDDEEEKFEDSVDIVPEKVDKKLQNSKADETSSSVQGTISENAEILPTSNGHPEQAGDGKSQEKPEVKDTSLEQRGDSAETDKVSNSIAADFELKDDEKLSSSLVPAESNGDVVNATEECKEENGVDSSKVTSSNPKCDQSLDTKSDGDPIVISTKTIESASDSQPTAENSAAS